MYRSVVLLLVLAPLLSGACVSYVDIKPPGKGSVLNPVLCDHPEGERAYLRRLRGKNGETIEYEYLDAVLGPKGNVLDMFSISNPAFASEERNPFQILVDLLGSEMEVPPAFRIYMDMYHPGVFETEPIHGYKINSLSDPHK